MGTNPLHDYRDVEEMEGQFRSLRHAIARIRTSIPTLTESFRVADAETKAAKAQAAADRQTALVLVLFAALLLLAALGGALTVRPGAARSVSSQAVTYPYLAAGRHDWLHLLTVGLLISAVSALSDSADQDRYAEEWAADLAEIHGRWRRLRWSLLLRAFGPRGINTARYSLRARRY